MHIKKFDISDLDFMDIVTTDFARDPEKGRLVIAQEATTGEAFTLCRNENSFYACCGFFPLYNNILHFWMLVDRKIYPSENNKKDFLILCTKLCEYVKAKYKGYVVQCIVQDKEPRFHTFVQKFGFKKAGTSYTGEIK